MDIDLTKSPYEILYDTDTLKLLLATNFVFNKSTIENLSVNEIIVLIKERFQEQIDYYKDVLQSSSIKLEKEVSSLSDIDTIKQIGQKYFEDAEKTCLDNIKEIENKILIQDNHLNYLNNLANSIFYNSSEEAEKLKRYISNTIMQINFQKKDEKDIEFWKNCIKTYKETYSDIKYHTNFIATSLKTIEFYKKKLEETQKELNDFLGVVSLIEENTNTNDDIKTLRNIIKEKEEGKDATST